MESTWHKNLISNHIFCPCQTQERQKRKEHSKTNAEQWLVIDNRHTYTQTTVPDFRQHLCLSNSHSISSWKSPSWKTHFPQVYICYCKTSRNLHENSERKQRESSVVIGQSLEMWPIFRQSAEISLFQMCTVGSGSIEHSNLNFFCSVSFMKKKFHHATFIIWILKSRILEVWREMSIILLGIYFDIIFHQNNLGSKHQIDH